MIFKGLQLEYKWLNEGMFVKGPDGKIALTNGKATIDKVLIVDFVLTNLTKNGLQDVKIECTQASNNWGSVQSIYTVPELQAESTKELKRVNLGEKHILRDRRSCKVKDFTIVR